MVLHVFELKGYASAAVLAPRIAICEAWRLHFNISGNHFGTSGEPWGAILAPRGRPGGPWEQQDGLEVVLYRILYDLGVILGLACISFLSSRSSCFFRACFQVICLFIFFIFQSIHKGSQGLKHPEIMKVGGLGPSHNKTKTLLNQNEAQ